MKKTLNSIAFITVNLILNLFYNALLWLIIYVICQKNIVIPTCFVGSYLVVTGVVLVLVQLNPKPFIEGDELSVDSEILKPFMTQLKEKKLILPKKLKFVKMKEKNKIPSPAFALLMENRVYLDSDIKSHIGYLGILAHECGHAESGFASKLYLRLFRFNVVIGNFILILMRQLFALVLLKQNNRKGKHVLYIPLFILLICYFIMTFLEQLLVVPFIKKDELKADYFAVKSGYGLELRTVLYEYLVKSEQNGFEKIVHYLLDLEHPRSEKRIELLNQYLNLDKAILPFYYYHDTLYYYDELLRNAELVEIPNIIKKVKRTAFSKSKVACLCLNNVDEIENGCFSYLTELTKIDMPNVKSVPPLCFKQCSKLGEVNMPRVSDIGSFAFDKCVSLHKLACPNVERIDTSAFKDCHMLQSDKIYNQAYLGKYYVEEVKKQAIYQGFDSSNDFVYLNWHEYIDVIVCLEGVSIHKQIKYILSKQGFTFEQPSTSINIEVKHGRVIVKDLNTGIVFYMKRSVKW